MRVLGGEPHEAGGAKAVRGLKPHGQNRCAGKVTVRAAAATSTGGGLTEDDLLGGAAGEQHDEVLFEVGPRLRPHLAGFGLGEAATGADRKRHRLGKTERAMGDCMTGFMIADPAPHRRRQSRSATAHGVEQECFGEIATFAAGTAAGLAHPALDVGAGVAAGGEGGGAQVDIFQVVAEVTAENTDQRRHVGQGDFDTTIETAGAHQGRVEPGWVVTSSNHHHAFAAIEAVENSTGW